MKHPIPFRKTPLVLAITASLASPIWVQAGPGDPQGPEFQVNTYTTYWQSGPAVAIDADGDFVVAWTSDGLEGLGQDGSDSGIYAQRYNRAGVAQGPEFQVNTYTTNRQGWPTVAMDADGDFVVAWISLYQDGSYWGIYAQRYDRAGVAQGPEFQVNTYTTLDQASPAIAMDADGNFVVAWISLYQDGSYSDIYAQRYNSVGEAQGPEFRVNTYTTDRQFGPAVAIDADGDFVVAWASTGLYYYGGDSQDGSYAGIYAQRYDRAGMAQGPEFQVNTYTTNNQFGPAVAMDADGDFVVAWTSTNSHEYDYGNGQDGSAGGIYAQRYNSAGVAQGPEFQVNTYTTNNQGGPTVAMDADGDFVVTWTSSGLYHPEGYREGQDGSAGGIYAQTYSHAGVAQGPEFRVNTYTTLDQDSPAVAIDADGDFVVAWTSRGQDGSYTGVYAQRYAGAAAGGTLTTIGLYDPAEGRFRLRTEHASGRANYTFRFGPLDSSRLPLAGDWNGNGQETVGLYDLQLGQFYLNNHLAWRHADYRFRFGPKQTDWIPIAGDWNGDGIATVGLYDPTQSKFFLRNSHTRGPADGSFRFGPGGFGWQPIAGDWDGDGRTTIGLYDPVTSRFYLRNRLAGGAADISFRFGMGNQGQVPLAGDWDGDGVTTVGLYDPATSRFYLNNRHAGGGGGYELPVWPRRVWLAAGHRAVGGAVMALS